jgi:hypothetical protein
MVIGRDDRSVGIDPAEIDDLVCDIFVHTPYLVNREVISYLATGRAVL